MFDRFRTILVLLIFIWFGWLTWRSIPFFKQGFEHGIGFYAHEFAAAWDFLRDTAVRGVKVLRGVSQPS
jgi:hypothetical protein